MKESIFDLEQHVLSLFDVVFPRVSKNQNSSGRAVKPVLANTLGSLVPDQKNSRKLQGKRDYVKIDYSDYIDFATSGMTKESYAGEFPDEVAVFVESISGWNTSNLELMFDDKKIFIKDFVVSRSGVFITVLMRFMVEIKATEALEENGVSITFAPESLNKVSGEYGKLVEFEKAVWFPPVTYDKEWRFINAGEFTGHILTTIENLNQPDSFSGNALVKLRNADDELIKYSGLIETCRLGFLIHKYLLFMHDLIITEKIETKSSSIKKRGPKNMFSRERKERSPITYKLIKSINVIHQNTNQYPEDNSIVEKSWVPPSYSFLVSGHWRVFKDFNRIGKDQEGNYVLGKTWVNEFKKYAVLAPKEKTIITENSGITIKIKQTLASARDLIIAYSKTNPQSTKVAPHKIQKQKENEINDLRINDKPSKDWMYRERSKLSSSLRFLILKKDSFSPNISR